MERLRSRTTYRSFPVFVLFFLLLFSSCSDKNQSSKRGTAKAGYSAVLESKLKDCRSFEGETLEILLRLKNTGKKDWSSEEKNPCLLSYHLLDEIEKVLKFDNPRTPLPRIVSPGEAIEISVKIKTPLGKGRYILEFDLVREGLSWFKDYGSKTLKIPLLAEEQRWPEDDVPLGLAYGKCTKFSSSVPSFETLRKLIRITLRRDEVEWTGKTGKISGFRAGSGYPQIWLRDAATIIPASRYYYPESFLTSWLEEHLAFQKSNGSLEDWIDAQGRTDKNTVETDQEASAVQSAYQVFLLKGPDWLRKEIAGEAIIDRLEESLLFLFNERFSEKYGLIRGAHTADWGDVEMEDADQRAIYVNENTHWTVDIYDQSMCFEACQELAEMFASLGSQKKADYWREKAEAIKKKTNEWLWQEDKGFYKVHIHLDSLRHDFDEDTMFAMGGNAQAILSGLTDVNKAGRIIEQALERQQQFNVSTLSGSLLPPYPAGLFKHPALDEPFEYQNGGQWDWFGGRLIYAMFENGSSLKAKEKILEIIKKNIDNAGLYEWDTREGTGRGSDYYGGSAGSLAKALFEGYFGLKIGARNLSLEPKLGEDEAALHAYLPAADLFVAYDYKPAKDRKKITFRYNSNFPHPGKIKILIPWALFNFPDHKKGRKDLEVSMDGAKVPFQWISVYSDDFIVLDTDFKNHTLEIKPAHDAR
jgi:hypothetical protein